MYDYGARFYDPSISLWTSVDPLTEKYPNYSGYNYVMANPIRYIDPDGMQVENPVYGSDGNYRGDTKEGFTGKVIIYDGDLDFSSMTKDELVNNTQNTNGPGVKVADYYDNVRSDLTPDAKSEIWTNIACHFEGCQIGQAEFTMDNLEGGRIDYEKGLNAGWKSKFIPISGDEWGHIRGEDKYQYETTVENLASSIIVHEWYTHIMQKQGSFNMSHSKAFDNVLDKNINPFLQKTTSGYNSFNVRGRNHYRKKEGR